MAEPGDILSVGGQKYIKGVLWRVLAGSGATGTEALPALPGLCQSFAETNATAVKYGNSYR